MKKGILNKARRAGKGSGVSSYPDINENVGPFRGNPVSLGTSQEDAPDDTDLDESAMNDGLEEAEESGQHAAPHVQLKEHAKRMSGLEARLSAIEGHPALKASNHPMSGPGAVASQHGSSGKSAIGKPAPKSPRMGAKDLAFLGH